MFKNWLVILLLWKGGLVFSQTIDVVQESHFKHDYVVSDLKFIEDPLDTPRLKYIATVKISDLQNQLLTVAGWFDLIKIKAKSYGANSYLVEHYSENENSVELILRFYFAGINFLKSNENKELKNSVVVFNQTRVKDVPGYFFLNELPVYFDSQKPYSIDIELQKIYYLATSVSNITATKILFKKNKASLFYIIPANKSTFVTNRNAFNPLQTGVMVNGVMVNFGRNAVYKLNYQQGRLLMEVYK